MSDQMFLAAIIGPMLLVMGLSVLLYIKVWQKIAADWAKDHTSMVGSMLVALIFGLVIINMHNVWEWSPYVVITIMGWGSFIKGVMYFLLPSDMLQGMIKKMNCKCYYQSFGVVGTLFGAWLSYLVYLA